MKKIWTRTSLARFLISTLLAALLAGQVGAASPVRASGPIDVQELAAWLDPLMAEKMADLHVPGAVFLLVEDGGVRYLQGYGSADITSGRAVDAGTDVWRVMSISKSFTAVAIMQLAEQGKLDLLSDINSYLKHLQLPARYAGPVTADNLLTHTAGLDFDSYDIGTQASDVDALPPLAESLQQHPPTRVRPPGRMTVYSNAGYDLLGLVVEDVSGQPFGDYMQDNILAPLEMESSSFVQPSPHAARLVTGYEYDGEFNALRTPIWNNPPSRTLTASAPDIARFMLALLGGGELDGARVLRQESVDALLSVHFAPAAPQSGAPAGDVSGAAYGFDARVWPGGRMLWKAGGAPGALSRLLLFPEDDLGFFIAYNLDDYGWLQNAVIDEFTRRYYPEMRALPADQIATAPNTAGLTGVYRLPNYSRHTISKGLRLMWNPYPRVDATADGILLVTYNPGSEPVTLAPVGPLQYRDTKDGFEYVFVTDERGKVTHYAVGTYVAEKVDWYDVDRNHRAALTVMVLILAVAAVTWPVVAVVRRRRGIAKGNRFVIRAALLLGFVALVDVAVLALLYTTLKNPNLDYAMGLPVQLSVALVLPFITGALAFGLLIASARIWRDGSLPTVGCVFFTLSSLVALLLIPWLNYWNLLGWRW